MNLIDKIVFDPISRSLKYFSKNGQSVGPGQYIEGAAASGVAIAQYASFTTISQVTLPPGTWMIYASAQINAASGARGRIALDTSANSGGSGIGIEGATSMWIALGSDILSSTSLRPYRRVVTSTTTIYLNCTMVTTTGTASGQIVAMSV